MEVPPFHWPKPAREHSLPERPSGRFRATKCRTGLLVKRAERKPGAPPLQWGGEPRLLRDTQCWQYRNGVPSPVLKHGPRSQTDAQGRRYRCQYFSRTERVITYLVCTQNECPTPTGPPWVEFECACLDPKGGELCLNKVKPGETQVEACSDADVQIARMIWVSERKTHRTT